LLEAPLRIIVLFGPLCLSFRKEIDFSVLRSDPRGLTGSELGLVCLAKELKALGHDVEISVVSPQTEWEGMRIGEASGHYDIALAINEPDTLRGVDAGFRATAFWLNDVTFCKPGFDSFVDLYFSPSDGHHHQMFTNPAWHRVAPDPAHPDGVETFIPDPRRWVVVPLGCEPERFVFTPQNDPGWAGQVGKIPGRCIYSSSPDRGLHWLLQEWPAIKRAVPHATLHIFYRLEPWIRGFDSTPYFPPIEPNRARALYVQEALARLSDPKWGITLRDSVSRETIEREMAQATVMAYPCDTLSWSEGFSCSLLEGCAARACPVTTDCDALGGVYGDALPLTARNGRDPKEWVPEWRQAVIKALTHGDYRDDVNQKARAFAEKLTWRRVAETYVAEIQKRRTT
jgi:glycosyltransferase involved in cell wall biosynthesis